MYGRTWSQKALCTTMRTRLKNTSLDTRFPATVVPYTHCTRIIHIMLGQQPTTHTELSCNRIYKIRYFSIMQQGTIGTFAVPDVSALFVSAVSRRTNSVWWEKRRDQTKHAKFREIDSVSIMVMLKLLRTYSCQCPDRIFVRLQTYHCGVAGEGRGVWPASHCCTWTWTSLNKRTNLLKIFILHKISSQNLTENFAFPRKTIGERRKRKQSLCGQSRAFSVKPEGTHTNHKDLKGCNRLTDHHIYLLWSPTQL
jgi:hypothetical protein